MTFAICNDIMASRDADTGRVTLTRIIGREVRALTLNDELSQGLTASHSLNVIWACAELVPHLATRSTAQITVH